MIEALIAILMTLLPPCPTDEMIGTCAWDATQHGNGQGTSFIVINGADPR